MTVSPAKESPILDTLREVVDGATAGKAFGTPVQHDGTLVLPVAKVGGGAGGGSGTGPAPDGQESGGTGGGLGLSAKPLGVYVLKNGRVSWRPAIDVNRIVLGGQIVAITGLLVLRAFLKARAANPGRRARKLPAAVTDAPTAARRRIERLARRATR
ncbi:spore germination protein GerW family protein [Pseudosporangium ferrugineum]|uniref:Sporulation protein YtfJ n=1 Tax=Pseudosporangium ferrugineum TaxID=439699 RepID=A0A2T0SG56_9ACTN|nr:spore germination protein GerW family protein [Pseudosporangium ferrugineum]PRY32391.1 sporulation protein YtfJ [Pseudosporangium ferrugineum]